MRRHWEAFWVFFNTDYDDPKRESIEEDYYTDERAGRRLWMIRTAASQPA